MTPQQQEDAQFKAQVAFQMVTMGVTASVGVTCLAVLLSTLLCLASRLLKAESGELVSKVTLGVDNNFSKLAAPPWVTKDQIIVGFPDRIMAFPIPQTSP